MPAHSERLDPAARRRGFTMVELLISIALLAFLMIGVTMVYTTVNKAVGAGQALAGKTRDSRAAQGIMYDDLKAAMMDGDPFFLVHNQRQAAFLRESDREQDADKQSETLDLDADGSTGGPGEDLNATPLAGTYRNCRTDLLGFFVRDLRRKQTGTGDQIVSRMGSRDSYVWYGHLAQVGQPGGLDYFLPGQGDPSMNESNFYSSKWVVGRVVTLLSEVTRDQDKRDQVAIDTAPAGSTLRVAMDAIASSNQPAAPTPEYRHLQSSRYDLVKGTATDERLRLQDSIARQRAANPNAPETWWQGLLYSARSQTPPGVPAPPAGSMPQVARFRAVPDPKVPLSGDGAALSAPLFLQNCRNFTVEFAGDFVTQLTDLRGDPAKVGRVKNYDPNVPDGEVTVHDLNDVRYGQVVAFEPDGKVDFYTVETGMTTPFGRERVERVRFYGLPRDADGRGTIRGATNNRETHELGSVLPLRDVVRSGARFNPDLANFPGADFERTISFGVVDDYAANRALPPDAQYTCVWGPLQARPKMIRIVVTLEDPDQRLAVGQTYEYVFEVGW